MKLALKIWDIKKARVGIGEMRLESWNLSEHLSWNCYYKEYSDN